MNEKLLVEGGGSWKPVDSLERLVMTAGCCSCVLVLLTFLPGLATLGGLLVARGGVRLLLGGELPLIPAVLKLATSLVLAISLLLLLLPVEL